MSLSTVGAVREQIDARRAADRASALQQELSQLLATRESDEAISECFLDLLEMLRAHRPLHERAAAVEALSDVLAEAYGEDGLRYGRLVRQSGTIDDLRDLLLQRQSRDSTLLALGNLASDAVDAESSATKAALLRCDGAAAALIACLDEAQDAESLSFAVACLQNLCHEREWSDHLVQRRVHVTLEALLRHPDELVVRYASGALKNIAVTLQDDGRLVSGAAAGAVRTRALQADAEDLRVRHAAAVIGAPSRRCRPPCGSTVS